MTKKPTYDEGYRSAWRHVLGIAINHLGADDPAAGKTAWILEREASGEASLGRFSLFLFTPCHMVGRFFSPVD